MTRPGYILSELLDVLADWDGPADEAVIHAQLNSIVKPAPERAEFNHAIKTADAEGWIAQIPSKRRGALWAITNKGKAERLS